MSQRSYTLDFLKGIAIVAVILFHSGLLNYGYLGVEVFFVISGYLTTNSIIRTQEIGNFSYLGFLSKRLVRLWPLVLIVSLVSLIIGYYYMLPMNFKNTCETIVGTNSFCNNFVQYITASNYWDVSNDYKPLMHTWYLGVLFQFYIIFPLFFIISKWVNRRYGYDCLTWLLSFFFVLSLVLYIAPICSSASKFYLLPARLFEFISGGLVALYTRSRANLSISSKWILILGLVILISINGDLETAQFRLLFVVALTIGILLIKESSQKISLWNNILFRIIVWMGKASLSLYIWHQLLLAFYRYSVNDDFSIRMYILVLGLSIFIGYISYRWIETPIALLSSKGKRNRRMVLAGCCIMFFLLTIPSAYFYRHQGVVRDVPELDIAMDNSSTNDPQSYNEKAKLLDVDFQDNGKKNVLVVGDSYGRDWINVLKESGITDTMNLSYHTDNDTILLSRLHKAEYVFVANNGLLEEKYASLIPYFMKCKHFWRVGCKNFGANMGKIYFHRNNDSYFEQMVNVSPKCQRFNNKERGQFSGNYIDILSAMNMKEGKVPAFTPNHKMISHDGLHLTRAGAKYLAGLLNLNRYFE